ncbi:MAG: lipoprotein-releasing system ATP-binding protein LolD [Flavobacteriales bacterium]|nr:lipoprotein-releasing system ATP-binding protein LolD [Flavobacteriales bacterium]|tara:strand:+ start:4614 stop:5270 length:657 start_codon:yes stop_codon:yes gene_type:complete
MIEINNLYKSFDKQQVLTNVNLHIKKNEMVAIQGPSGAGKTTLLKSIGLLDTINGGNILFNGKDITKYNHTEACKFRNQKIGFVFQFHNLLPEFNAIENICIPALINKTKSIIAEGKAKEIMRNLDIIDKKYSKPSELSGGEQQRVAIARALINSPEIILADEPTGNLDSKQSMKMFELFNKISKDLKTTFIIITHNNKLANMCNRIIKIHDGKILKS